jgi:hypothetical protein
LETTASLISAQRILDPRLDVGWKENRTSSWFEAVGGEHGLRVSPIPTGGLMDRLQDLS